MSEPTKNTKFQNSNENPASASPKKVMPFTNFACLCGFQLDSIKAAESHFLMCAKFGEKFGELHRNMLKTLNSVKNELEFDILKLVWKICKTKVKENIEIKLEKDAKFDTLKHANTTKPKVLTNEDNKNSTVIIPIKNIEFVLGDPLQSLPEMPSPSRCDQIDPYAELMSCFECQRQFYGNILTNLSCNHTYCTGCLKNKIFREYPENGQVLCKCKNPIKEAEFQVILLFA